MGSWRQGSVRRSNRRPKNFGAILRGRGFGQFAVAPGRGRVIGALKKHPEAGRIDFGVASKLVPAKLP
jgi:hypothetical protein